MRIYLFLAVIVLFPGRGICAEDDLLWIRTYDSSTHSHDAALAVDTDGEGNAYVAGYETRTDRAEGQNALIRKYDPAGILFWSDSYGSEMDRNDVASAIAVAPGEVVYAAGHCLGTTYYSCGWLRKLGSAGNEVWTLDHCGGAGSKIEFKAVAVDSLSGSVYAAGRTCAAGSVQWDGLLVKYSADGSIIWSRTVIGPADGDDSLAGVAVDRWGSVIVAGSITERKTPPKVDYDIFVRKYSPAGTEIWTKTYGSEINESQYYDDRAAAVDVDEAGDIYLTGYIGLSGYDRWIRKYNSQGTAEIWILAIDINDSYDMGYACRLGPNGRLHIAGWSLDPDFSYRGKDLRTEVIDSMGGILLHSGMYDSQAWTGGGTADDYGYGISAAPDGSYYVAGAELREDLGQGLNWLLIKYAGADATGHGVEEIVAYPNPFNPRKAVGGTVKFANLPAGCRIRIYTSRGRLVREIAETGNGAAWDGRNSAGRPVATGAYLFVVESPGGKLSRGKLAVINQ